MTPRSAHAPRSPAYRPPARPAPRPMDDTVDALRVAGFVMLGLAVLQLVEKFVLSFWLDLGRDAATTVGSAVFSALFGVAMLQGRDGARKVVLVLSALGLLAVLALAALLALGGFGHLWPLLAALAVSAAGTFLLTMAPEQRRAVVLAGLACVAIGWVGSLVASIVLVGALDLGTVRAIREWSSPQRTFEHADSGIALKVPPRWVLLKPGSPLADEAEPLLALAHTEVLATAQVLRETRTYSSADNLEFFLDAAAKARAARETGFEPGARSDTRVGSASARRMRATWQRGSTEMAGSFTAWQDGAVFYTLLVTAPRVLSRRLDEEVPALESGIAFSAPWAAFLRDRAAPVRAECPLLSEAIVITLAGAIPRDSPPETYCREGYRLAYAGQPSLDPTSGQRLGARMKTFFAGLPRGRTERFGQWVERVRARRPTTPAEDREMTGYVKTAMAAVEGDAQDDLRAHFAMAIDMGLFDERRSAVR